MKKPLIKFMSTLLLAAVLISSGFNESKYYGSPSTGMTITPKETKPQVEDDGYSLKLTPPEIDVVAEAFAAVDVESGEVIISKKANEKMFPASITKLMTALILAETKGPNDMLSFSEKALSVEPYAINTNLFKLNKGDKISVKEAISAIMLVSANDVAIAAAEGVSGSTEEFVSLMNRKAESLGMKNTHFSNPVGLHDEQNYSTAYDLSLLMKAAYENRIIREEMLKKEAEINTELQKIGKIENKNILVGKDGNLGGKTGFTDEAGRTLTCMYMRPKDGKERLIAVTVLKSGDNIEAKSLFDDMAKVADIAYETKRQAALLTQDKIASFPVKYKLFKWFGPDKKASVPVYSKDSLEIYPAEENIKDRKIDIKANDDIDIFNLQKNQEVGKVKLVAGNLEKDTSVYASTDTINLIIMPNIIPYMATLIALILVLVITIVIALKIIRKSSATGAKIRERRHQKRARNIRKNRFDNEI